MAFKVELAFQGGEDRLDRLPQRLEEPAAGPFGFTFAGPAQQVQAGLRYLGFEAAALIVLVREQCSRSPQK